MTRDCNSGRGICGRWSPDLVDVVRGVGFADSCLADMLRLAVPESEPDCVDIDISVHGGGFMGQSGSGASTYTGTAQDTLTGLYYFGSRFYDAGLGRFVTEDSNGGVLGDPMSLNRYAYARDNPMRYIDPNGHDWWNNWNDFVNTLQGVSNNLQSWWNGLSPAAQVGLSIAGFAALGLATGGIGDVIAAATAGDYVGAAALALTGGGVAVTSSLEGSGSEVDALGMDEWIASLTTNQFDSLVRNEPETAFRTDLVQSRLASELGGTTEEQRIFTSTPVEGVQKPFRVYDVVAKDLRGELKFAGDPLQQGQLNRDMELMQSGLNVHYYLIDDPITQFDTRPATMGRLEMLGIPYTHFTWTEFLGWLS